MNLNTWLDEAPGRLTSMAAHFGVTQSAISQWRKAGVPLGRMRMVSDYTGGAVGLEDMVPTNPRKEGQHENT
jgi:DNA-binding transcriptional regulator YdaS (Cro superfamily)